MREIKFRVWNPELERMYKIKKENYLGSVGIIDNLVGGKESKWMQYTGLKDKNGVEIYEGDILKRGDFPDEQPQYIVRFGKFTDSHDMYYEEEYSGWYVDEVGEQDKYRNPLTYIVDMLDGEVCGNIYEHPHLRGGIRNRTE